MIIIAKCKYVCLTFLILVFSVGIAVADIIYPVMDTWAYGAIPNNNYSTAKKIYGFPTSNCNAANGHCYIQFDITNMPQNVWSVFLCVTHYPHTNYCHSNCSADFYFYPVLESWQDTTLTYNNKPSEGSAEYGPIHISFPNDFGSKEYDITNLYKKWKTGELTNYGISIYSPTVGCNNASVMFAIYSKEADASEMRPYLKIIRKSSAVISVH